MRPMIPCTGVCWLRLKSQVDQVWMLCSKPLVLPVLTVRESRRKQFAANPYGFAANTFKDLS